MRRFRPWTIVIIAASVLSLGNLILMLWFLGGSAKLDHHHAVAGSSDGSAATAGDDSSPGENSTQIHHHLHRIPGVPLKHHRHGDDDAADEPPAHRRHNNQHRRHHHHRGHRETRGPQLSAFGLASKQRGDGSGGGDDEKVGHGDDSAPGHHAHGSAGDEVVVDNKPPPPDDDDGADDAAEGHEEVDAEEEGEREPEDEREDDDDEPIVEEGDGAEADEGKPAGPDAADDGADSDKDKHHHHHNHHHSGKESSPPEKHHHGGGGGSGGGKKSKKGFYNINNPDDMKPATLEPVTFALSGLYNRTYAVFQAVGDWGGPGRQPQQEVARSMGQVAEGGLRMQVEPKHRTALPVGTALRDGVAARRRLQGPFVCVDGINRTANVFDLDEHSPFAAVQATIDFIVSTGDNMYEDGVKNEHDHKFQRNFERVYTHRALRSKRWYMSLGNHDHGAHGVMRDVRGQIRYTNHSDRWFLPSSYYRQRMNFVGASDDESDLGFTLDLIVLDTYDVSPYMTKMSDGQVLWFDHTLKNSDADWKIVVGHRPILSAGSKHGSSPYMKKNILARLARYGADLYLSGDDHELQLLESEGVLLGVSGGGARAKSDLKQHGLRETLFQAGVHGFMTVQVSRTALAVSVHDKAGKVLKRVVRDRTGTSRDNNADA